VAFGDGERRGGVEGQRWAWMHQERPGYFGDSTIAPSVGGGGGGGEGEGVAKSDVLDGSIPNVHSTLP
jgi:hypothetical protein